MVLDQCGRWFVRVAGISGAVAVGLGAYGSHGKFPTNKFTRIDFTLKSAQTISDLLGAFGTRC